MAEDAEDPGVPEHGPDEMARLLDALHPSKEEDARAERFAARLLEHPTAAGPIAAPGANTDAGPNPVAAADGRSWQRDVLMAAIGVAIGVVGTLIVTAVT